LGVFVDNMKASYGRMTMCHMFSDSDEELHAMAAKIGVARKWFQRPPKAAWRHYDICLSMRAKALRLGAIEMGWRDLPAWVKANQPERSAS
jgi:hypothetical protein